MNPLPACVLYVDHSFHQHTKSTQFFFEALKSRVETRTVWDDSWQGGSPVMYDEIKDFGATCAVFFQTFPTPEFVARFKKPIVVIPMFDDPTSKEMMGLLAVHHVSVICFTDAVRYLYADYGMNVLPIRYAPSISDRELAIGAPNIFFWERGPITWSDVKTWIGDQQIGKVYLKLSPDRGYEPSSISDKDHERYNLEVITNWLGKEEYMDILCKCQIYVAPRLAEGIGMSFLEAMAEGLAVIAPDRPSMNEYIVHGENGYLAELPVSGSIDLSEAAKVGLRARESIHTMRLAFEPRLGEIIEQILRLEYRPPKRADLWRHEAKMIPGNLRRSLIRSLRPKA